jgi:glycosyltransferase involved in cell wall biosynthesis
MDVLVFPSRTDTYGNVVQEAMASAVPAIVTDGGGPKFLLNEGVNGFICANDEIFLDRTLQLFRDRALHRQMSFAAREHALTLSWDRVFEDVWDVYRKALEPEPLFRVAV